MAPPPITARTVVAGRVLVHRRPQRSSTAQAARSSSSGSALTSRDKENVPPPAQQPPAPPQTLMPPPSTQPRPTSTNRTEGEDDDDDSLAQSDDSRPEDIEMLHALDANASEATRAATGTQEFFEAACVAARFLGHYPDLVRVLTEGLTYVVEDVPLEERPLSANDKYDASVETDIVWDAVEIFLPKLIRCAPYILRHDDLIARIAHYLESITKYVRGNDLTRIKSNIMKIANIPDPDSVFEDKSNRGWNSKNFAELLVPLTDLDAFKADPEGYCDEVLKGTKYILSDDWPVCFYDLKKVQPGKAKPGFLMSLFLERIYRWLITGKGSVFNAQYNAARRYRGRPSVAHNGKVKFVTLPSILYAAIIGRHCLTSSTNWSDVDGAYWSGEEFVKSVYEAVFYDPDWADELEAWWTKRIYGPGGEGENDALVHKRKDTAFKRFLQECDGGNPRKRVKPNAAPATGDEQPDASTSG